MGVVAARDGGLHWPDEPPTLRGSSVVLRPWRTDDVDAVHEACQDADIQRWTTVPSPYRREHATSFVGDFARSRWASGEGAPLCISDGADGGVLGACDLVRISSHDRVAEIGYWSAPWARHRGAATEAVDLLARWALEQVGFDRLELLIDPENLASRRVAERVGAGLEGILRHKALIRGERRDMAIYALLSHC
jgi:RimJ/RimL family protein N-acetyltransferase